MLAATALMAQDNNPAQPRSMTLMAGPSDTRLSPTKVNELVTSKPIDMQAGVGHFGVFSGRRWQGQIYPLVRNAILAND